MQRVNVAGHRSQLTALFINTPEFTAAPVIGCSSVNAAFLSLRISRRRLKFPADTCIGEQRSAWAQCAWIGKAEKRNLGGIEKCSEIIVTVIEQVLHQAKYFQLF